jgi:hypothetical protein
MSQWAHRGLFPQDPASHLHDHVIGLDPDPDALTSRPWGLNARRWHQSIGAPSRSDHLRADGPPSLFTCVYTNAILLEGRERRVAGLVSRRSFGVRRARRWPRLHAHSGRNTPRPTGRDAYSARAAVGGVGHPLGVAGHEGPTVVGGPQLAAATASLGMTASRTRGEAGEMSNFPGAE